MGSKSKGGKFFEAKHCYLHSMGKHVWMGIFVAGVLGAWTAFAQPKLTAFFIESEASLQDSVEKVKAELMEALSSSKEVELLPIPRVLQPMEVLIPPAVSNAFREAYSAKEATRYSEARLLFKSAIEFALKQPERAYFGQVFDAHVAWAFASVEDGNQEEARVALRALARLAPDYNLPKDLPPVFQREFERAKLLTSRLPKGTLVVEAPEGAVVFLNGRPVGIAPVVVANLPQGTHYVYLEDSNQFDMRFGQVVELQSEQAKVRGEFSRVSVRLPSGFVVDPILTPVLDAEALERLSLLARDLGAAFVLVGFIKELGPGHFNLSMTLFHARKKQFLSLAPMGFSKNLIGKAFLGKRVSSAVLQRIRLADKEPPVSLPLDWRGVAPEEFSSLRGP